MRAQSSWPVAALLCASLLAPLGSAAEADPAQLTIDPHELTKPFRGDLDAMVERRIIRVLTFYSRTFYFADRGTQRGVTYEALRLFEKDLNEKLAKAGKRKQKHLGVQVFFIPVDRDELLPALQAGKGDVAAANLTITPERLARVDFSAPAYPNVSEVLVSGPASPAVASLDDLAGQQVFVNEASSYHESLVALNRRLAEKKLPAVAIRPAPNALADEDLIEMVNAGLIPFTVVDRHLADFWKQVFPQVVVHDEIPLRTGGDIAWAVRKGSPQLKAALDDFLARNRKGTLAGNVILKRYLASAAYVKDAGSEAERKKFLDLVQYFRKYADQYDVDWLLMAAQGYQESRLDQSVRSPVGAVGVMQVMPATGKDLDVGDIRQTEANIHAGIKYVRWMIDRYYGDEPMTALDKALFAFASYNAGPRRVAELRKEAARRGLDPNVWFHNVEYVAADEIGAETVTYVSNIYKYYVAYNLIMAARAEKERAVQALGGEGPK